MSVSIVDVQSDNASAATKQIPAFASDPANGDVIIVATVNANNGPCSINAPVDTQSNAYTLITQKLLGSTGFYGCALHYAENIVGGSSFRVTGSASATGFGDRIAVVAWCVRGLPATGIYNGDLAYKIADFYHGIGGFEPAHNMSEPVDSGYTTISDLINTFQFAVLFQDANEHTPDYPNGWNDTVNGFTSGMDGRAVNASPVFFSNPQVYIRTQFKMGSTPVNATWVRGSGIIDENDCCLCVTFGGEPVDPCNGGGNMPSAGEITDSEDWGSVTTKPPNSFLTIN